MTEITRDDRDRIRAQFPALAGDTVFLENAGGSQVPATVADGIRDYMLSSYVQIGASYPLSQRCTELVDSAHDFVRLLMNGGDGEVILGPSTSSLLQMLAGCYSTALTPGSEIVVAQTGHEANVGPWKKLERLGFPLRWWEMDPATCRCPMERLEELLKTDEVAGGELEADAREVARQLFNEEEIEEIDVDREWEELKMIEKEIIEVEGRIEGYLMELR